MTASVEILGDIHTLAAQLYKELVSVREEPMTDKEGAVLCHPDTGLPLMRKVYPTAAELAQVNAFLKNNNITAKGEDGGALDDLQKMVEARRAKRARPVAQPALPDPYGELPTGFGGLQ